MEASTLASDRKKGEVFEQHAIVLSSIVIRESDKLVNLYTRDLGKIAVLAKCAAKSLKRFGPGLEPFTHIKAQLKKPKGSGEETKIWLLQRADIQSSFMHLRKNYESIEASFFVVKLVLDLLPEGAADAMVFKALGRFLRDVEVLNLKRHSAWARVAFLVWFAKHSGFGAVDEGFWEFHESVNAEVKDAWKKCLLAGEPNFKNLFEVVELLNPPSPSLQDEIKIYQKWVESSGLHWEYFEKWLSLKNF